MSYELVRSVRNLIQQGIGDEARLEYILDRIENGKYLYLADQKYLENLFNENNTITSQPKERKTDSRSLEKLENDLKNLNAELEKILKKTERIENNELNYGTKIIETPHKREASDTIIPAHYKKEETALILSVVLGLISLQGIGHIYIGKIGRGVGILALSLLLFTLWISYVTGIIAKDAIPSFASFYFLPVVAVGYLGLYVFQILDSRKLCVAYNKYISEQGNRPPWW